MRKLFRDYGASIIAGVFCLIGFGVMGHNAWKQETKLQERLQKCNALQSTGDT